MLVVYYYMNWGVNMNKIYIGKVVNTHGIKGEIRILKTYLGNDKITVNDNDIGEMKTNLGGKLMFSLELDEGVKTKVLIEKM